MKSGLLFLLILLLGVTACQPAAEEPAMKVAVRVDGRQLDFQVPELYTVEEFLTEAEIEWDEDDRITPRLFTQINDGMIITIVRVSERTECETEQIPKGKRVVPQEGLNPGEERLGQAGTPGEREVCYRIPIEDGIEQERILIRSTVLTEPVDDVVFVGIDQEAEPIPLPGTLAYIGTGNAWIIDGSSTNKRPITETSNLDSHVFSLSQNGNYLIFTSTNTSDDVFFNQLWMIRTTGNSDPVPLVPSDVLYADWVPGTDNAISYSTGEARDVAPFWLALNNLWLMRIDLDTGETIDIDPIVEGANSGIYGWWGTVFEWSPDGSQLAYIQADSIGLVDLETGDLNRILDYPVYNTHQSWSWRANVSWSWDSQLLTTIVHGPPVGTEPADTSPVFDMVVTNTNGDYEALVYHAVGMWSTPQFSPQVNTPDSQYPTGYVAYLRSRRPYNSLNGEYDLIVADRDGSNARVIFPDSALPGIQTSDFGLTPKNFTWSPDGTHIAVIYQNNLWVVNVNSGVATQLTFDGGAENPVWAR